MAGRPKMYECNECSAAWSESGKVTQCFNCKTKNISIFWEPGKEKFDINDPMWRVSPVPSRRVSGKPPIERPLPETEIHEEKVPRGNNTDESREVSTLPAASTGKITDLF